MPKKLKVELNDKQINQGIAESANQIWLAGLAAFEKAQVEGSKFFESLVQEGQAIEARSRKLAADKIEETRARVQEARNRVQEAKDRAFGSVDKLEQVFQDRVSRSLKRLGVPTHDDLERLSAQLTELDKAIKELSKRKNP